MNSTRIFLFIFYLIISTFIFVVGVSVNHIYNFGDSISDTGNLILEGTGPMFEPIKHLPYGQTIEEATGRCSDGWLIIDYIAQTLGLPTLNPYLNENADFTNGVNFAVAGATALDTDYFKRKGFIDPFTNSSLMVQLSWFKKHIEKVQVRNFDDSLFLLGEIGGNDYNYAFLAGKSSEEVTTYIPDVVKMITDVARELINLGASRIIIPGNFPLGCFPSYLTLFETINDSNAKDERGCIQSLNAFAKAHNAKLKKAIASLSTNNPGVTISYADYYNIFLHLLDDPANYGFLTDKRLEACCGGGDGKYNYDSQHQCGGDSSYKVCENPSQYLSWDGIHLTQNAYTNMGKLLMSMVTPQMGQ